MSGGIVYGGAVYNTGTLTLESCIFSGNWARGNAYGGGGVYSTGDLTIRGCTFYENISGYYGGAVYFDSEKTLTLTGNLFYGNKSYSDYDPRCPVLYATWSYKDGVYTPNGTITASYNVVDRAFGMDWVQCGWNQGTGDIYSSGLFVVGEIFKVPSGSPAAQRLPNPLPAGYPTEDFYGRPVSAGGTAGAVQAVAAHGSGYYYLDLRVNDSQRGSVSTNPNPDADGLYSNNTSVTLTATPKAASYSFAYWLHDGTKITANPYTAAITAHTRIQAVFGRMLTVDAFSDEPGSDTTPGTLRYALTNAQDGDVIIINGVRRARRR
jgi:hypothetical protein